MIQTSAGLDGGGSVSADNARNICVAGHAPEPGASRAHAGTGCQRGGEPAHLAARSVEEGKAFAREQTVSDKETGVCGCYGIRAFSDRKDNDYMLYRSTEQAVNRDTYLLSSKDKGRSFQSGRVQP